MWWAYARPSYVSAASLVIDQPHLVAASLDQGAFAKLEILRNTYAQLITTPVFAIPVSQQLSLPEGVVAHAAVAGGVPGTQLLIVGARSRNGRLAQRIASGLAWATVTGAANLQQSEGIPLAQQFSFSIITPATRPARLPTKRLTLERVGVVAALGCFLAGTAAEAWWNRRGRAARNAAVVTPAR